MAGLLDFALGFGAGASGAYAQSKGQEIQNRAEEVRMRNLERLRAQYRRDEMDYGSQLRREEAVLEASLEQQEEPKPLSPAGRLAYDLRNAGSDEERAQIRSLYESDQRRRSTTGNRLTLVNARGETRTVDAGEDLTAYQREGFYELLSDSAEADPYTKETFISDSAGRTYLRRRGELIPQQGESQPASTQSPAQETPTTQEGQDSIPEGQREAGQIYSQIAVGKGIGPLDAALRGVLSAPGIANYFSDEVNTDRIRSDQILEMVKRDLVRAMRYNDERTTNLDLEQALEAIPGTVVASEENVFTRFGVMSQEFGLEISNLNRLLEEHQQNSTLSPSQVQGYTSLRNSLSFAKGKLDALVDARLLSSVEIGGIPVGELTNEQLRRLDRRRVTPLQAQALDVRRRYIGRR